MANTVKTVILETLESLNSDDLERFRFRLLELEDEVRFRRSDVMDRNVNYLTDLLVSRFTKRRAPAEVVKILKSIRCNEEAKTLEFKAKTSVDIKDLRRQSKRKLPSDEAQPHVAEKRDSKAAQPENTPVAAKKPLESVATEDNVRSNDLLVLGGQKVQFGKYKDETFKWVLENHMSYVAWIASEQMAGESVTAHAEALILYAKTFPGFELLLKLKQEEKKRSESLKGKVVKVDDETAEDGKVKGGKVKGGKAEDRKAEDGKAEKGKVKGGKAEKGKAEGGKVNGGKAEGGKVKGGKAEKGKAKGGKAEDKKPKAGTGKSSVGFGPYKDWTLKKLYNSKEKDVLRFVEYLRGEKDNCAPGSERDSAVKYILKCDKIRNAAAAREEQKKNMEQDQSAAALPGPPDPDRAGGNAGADDDSNQDGVPLDQGSAPCGSVSPVQPSTSSLL